MTGDELVTYIASLSPLAGVTLTPGTNLFDVPPTLSATEQEQGVWVHVYGGKKNTRGFGVNASAPLGENPAINVYVRDGRDNELACRELAYALYEALDNFGPGLLGSVLYRNIRSIGGEPQRLPLEINNQRPTYLLMLEADKVQS